ncbi:hypothetical protein [Phorcysia thermohydrogeniphila]|uniref:Uncharacterized protein n=1 Tax=Phorcysia thermohydrogeniphila TaxID=936138 RepID=A0A4R1GH57_9BACT|nr:hypothetical protein [Phorcysia thermohydrogeniphila]TCK06343.1 hypothetical protein CLV27_0144 [Phorcysia thermohydrogeniphila]
MKTAKVEKPAFIRKLEEEGKKELATVPFRFYNTLCRHEEDFPFLQDDSVKESLTKLMLETFQNSPDGELTAKKLMSLPLTDLQEYIAATVKQALKAFEEKMEKRLEKVENEVRRTKKELKEHIDDRGTKIVEFVGDSVENTMDLIASHSEAIRQEIRNAKEEIKKDNAERAFLHERGW